MPNIMCPNCGMAIDSSTNRCPRCLEEILDREKISIGCPHCGDELKYVGSIDICPRCRKKLPDTIQNLLGNLPVDEPSSNYFIQHWRGELSLSISFWRNCVLVNLILSFLYAVIEISIMESRLAQSTTIVVVLFFVFPFVIYVWQVVGLWRSSVRHELKTRRIFIPVLVRSLIILSVLLALGNIYNFFTGKWKF